MIIYTLSIVKQVHQTQSCLSVRSTTHGNHATFPYQTDAGNCNLALRVYSKHDKEASVICGKQTTYAYIYVYIHTYIHAVAFTCTWDGSAETNIPTHSTHEDANAPRRISRVKILSQSHILSARLLSQTYYSLCQNSVTNVVSLCQNSVHKSNDPCQISVTK